MKAAGPIRPIEPEQPLLGSTKTVAHPKKAETPHQSPPDRTHGQRHDFPHGL